MYDWASSAMQTTIMVAVFPIYFVKVAGAGIPESGATQRLAAVNSLDNLMTFPRLRKLIERGSVSIHGAYFGVATGSLLVCDREGSEFVPVAQAEHAKLLQAPRF